jgi:hypothetical protein
MARAMTESVWLSSDYGPVLFEFVERKASRRKKLLISAAILTRLAGPPAVVGGPVRHDLDAAHRLIVQEADGVIPSAFMVVNNHVRVDKYITAAIMGQASFLTRLIDESAGYCSPAELQDPRLQDPEYVALRQNLNRYLADVVRDVIGNPFRSRAFQKRWRTEDTVGLARGIEADLAFDRLLLLADALMDAGCDNERILAHCHSPGPHVRGCWVVDLVLGKD